MTLYQLSIHSYPKLKSTGRKVWVNKLETVSIRSIRRSDCIDLLSIFLALSAVF